MNLQNIIFTITKLAGGYCNRFKTILQKKGQADKGKPKKRSTQRKVSRKQTAALEELLEQEDICNYLKLLDKFKDRYMLLLTTQGDWWQHCSSDVATKIQHLGAQKNLLEAAGSSYILVLRNGRIVYEKVGAAKETLLYRGKKHALQVCIVSRCRAGKFSNNPQEKPGISIAGKIVTPGKPGVSIVVYDEVAGNVVDAVCFNTASPRGDVFRPLQYYTNLLSTISELHVGYGYTIAQWLADNDFTTITLYAEPQFEELTRAVALSVKMNDAVFVKKRFTSGPSFVWRYFLHSIFLREKYVSFKKAKITSQDVVVHMSPFSDEQLQRSVEKRGGVFLQLPKLLNSATSYCLAENSVVRLVAETPGLYAVALSRPTIQNDPSSEAKRLRGMGLTRPEIIRALENEGRDAACMPKLIREDTHFSDEDWLEMLGRKLPQAYNDKNGFRVLKDSASRLVNIVNGHRLTAYSPEVYDNTIYIFGGCGIFGVGSADHQTMASYMQKLLNEALPNGKTYRVENYGHFLQGHYSDYARVISSIKPKKGDIIIYGGEGNKKIPHADFSKIILPEDYGYLFFDKVHHSYNMNRFMAAKIYEYLRDNIFSQPPPSEITYKTLQIPLCGLQISSRNSNNLPFAYQEQLQGYKNKLSIIRKERVGAIGSIVMNCNPFTLGHRYLIEYAASKANHVFLFVVEENKSFFPFNDRFELVKAGTKDLENVTVLPSGQFIISALTFSDYFQKESIQDTLVDPSQDVELFAKEIAPALGISVRFAGEEPLDKVTRQYNDAMRTILPQYGIEFEVIPRKESYGHVISASNVRKFLEAKDFDAIANLVPESTLSYLMNRCNATSVSNS